MREAKRFVGVGVILCAAILAIVLSPHGAAAETPASISTDVLNVRAEPNTDADIYGELFWGEEVTILDGPYNGDWYYVRFWGNNEGWVSGEFISFGAVGGPSFDAGESWSGDVGYAISSWVDTDALNVRGGPSGSSEVLDLVSYGDALTIVGDEYDGYVPISHWSGHGWVWSGYLSYDGQLSAAAEAERWIDIDRSSQVVTLYEGDIVIASYWAALGRDLSDSGFFATANGTYYVYSKVKERTWTDWGQVWIEDWVGFDPVRQNGFHTYSLDRGGRVLENGDGPTGGCVALDRSASDAVFAFSYIGMRVMIHW